jgi:predicted RNA-binding Zn-ribbon protein involved in translation (DUF1610 family)
VCKRNGPALNKGFKNGFEMKTKAVLLCPKCGRKVTIKLNLSFVCKDCDEYEIKSSPNP